MIAENPVQRNSTIVPKNNLVAKVDKVMRISTVVASIPKKKAEKKEKSASSGNVSKE